MDKDFRLQTEFTMRQLERLSELVSAAHGARPTPEDHNLLRKLTEYCASANHLQRLRRTG
jgi:hypothetical protein